jgi:hypothetical protein
MREGIGAARGGTLGPSDHGSCGVCVKARREKAIAVRKV